MSFTNLLLQTPDASAELSHAATDLAENVPQDPGLLGGPLGSLLLFIIIIAIFYLFIIRPQSKKQKEADKMIKALKKGDKVVTIGGIHGVISSTKETTVIVKVDDNTKIEFNRTAIASVIAATSTDSNETKSEVNK